MTVIQDPHAEVLPMISMPFENLAIAVYIRVDDGYPWPMPVARQEGAKPVFSDSEVIMLLLYVVDGV